MKNKGKNEKAKKNEGKTTITPQIRGKNTKNQDLLIHLNLLDLPLLSFFFEINLPLLSCASYAWLITVEVIRWRSPNSRNCRMMTLEKDSKNLWYRKEQHHKWATDVIMERQTYTYQFGCTNSAKVERSTSEASSQLGA